MILGYSKPQSRLFQIRANTNLAASDVRHTCIVAPRYRTVQYGIDDVPISAYAAQSAAQTLPLQYLNSHGLASPKPVTETLDQSFTRLFGKGLETTLSLTGTGGSDKFTVRSAVQSNVLELSSGGKYVAAGSPSDLLASLFGRPVTPGDVCLVGDGVRTFKRRVLGIRGKTLASTWGVAESSPGVLDNRVGNGAYNPVTTGSSTFTSTQVPTGNVVGDVTCANAADFEGTVLGALRNNALGDLFTLTVVVGGAPGTAQVSVTSATGLYSGVITTADNAGTYDIVGNSTNLGGLTVNIDPTLGTLTAGQVFQFTVATAYTRLADSGSVSKITATGTYLGAVDTTFVIEVTTGTYNSGAPTATGAVVRITDTVGLYAPVSHTLTDGTPFTLGASGLSATIHLLLATCPQGGLRKGDRYYITSVASHEDTVDYDKVVLDGPAVDLTVFTNFSTAVSVEFRKPFTGEILSTDNSSELAWTQNATTGVTVETSLNHFVTGRDSGNEWCPFVDGVGSLALTWRSLQPVSAGQHLITVSTEAEIIANLGPIVRANDAAFAASLALKGSQGKAIYVRPVGGTTVSDYNTAFAAIARSAFLRYIYVAADDATIRAALGAHVTAASAPEKKFFREGFCGTDSQGEYLVLDTVAGDPLTCTVSAYHGSGNLLVTATNAGVDFTALDLTPGDLVKFPVLGGSYEIVSVLSATELVLATGPVSPVSPATSTGIWKADTELNQALWARKQAIALNNFRVRVLWTEGALDSDDNEALPARFIAAEYAGLRSALPANQSLTRQTLLSVASVAPMYLRYEDGLLDTVAADGVTIVAQDAEGGGVYIRHELTTKTDSGALYYEGMVVSNVDDISAELAIVDESFVGRKNLTQDSMLELRQAWIGNLQKRTQSTYGAATGPSITRFDTPVVVADKSLKDRAKVSAKVYVPLPFNHVDGEISVDQDSSLLTISQI